jgi:hypothetical protein
MWGSRQVRALRASRERVKLAMVTRRSVSFKGGQSRSPINQVRCDLTFIACREHDSEKQQPSSPALPTLSFCSAILPSLMLAMRALSHARPLLLALSHARHACPLSCVPSLMLALSHACPLSFLPSLMRALSHACPLSHAYPLSHASAAYCFIVLLECYQMVCLIAYML